MDYSASFDHVTYNNTIGVMITYNPSIVLSENLSIITHLFGRIVIVDNHSKDCVVDYLRNITTGFSNIEVIYLAENYGIAAGLNIGIKRALGYEPRWIVTFDQDSCPYNQFLPYYNKALSMLNIDTVGLLSCMFSDKKRLVEDNIRIKQKYSIITSGCLHNVEIFKSVGFYNEQLFIDGVDFDFCLRVAMAGFKTMQINQCLLHHHLGDPVYRKLFGIQICSTNHSILRRYYMSRNHVYIMRKYFKKFPLFLLKKNISFLLVVLKVVYVENCRLSKLSKIWQGILDGFKM